MSVCQILYLFYELSNISHLCPVHNAIMMLKIPVLQGLIPEKNFPLVCGAPTGTPLGSPHGGLKIVGKHQKIYPIKGSMMPTSNFCDA